MTICLRYTCDLCGLNDVSLDVPAREHEDVVAWMHATVQRVADDHRRLSPGCPARELTHLKIPISGAQKVGGPPIQ